ncbi:hypothetical protein Bca101_035407 [Brassica carinata]
MIYLWPNSLLLAAIYGAIESGSSAIFGPIVGQWIEGMDYVKVLRLWLLCQNLSYIIAGGAVIKLLLDYDLKPRNIPVFATLVALTNVAGAIGVLSTLGGTILIERDWAVIMSEGHPPAVLTRMNSVIRGIDLSSKLLSPVFTGLIISFVSLKASAITFAFWATITAWVEYWLFISVYNGAPAISQSNERRILRSMTNPVEETNAHVSVSIVRGTGNPPRRTAMLKVFDRVSKSSFVGAWRVYIKQEVVLPGVSLALLFFTVLRLRFSLCFGLVHMWMSSKMFLSFKGLWDLFTALIQLWNIDDGYIAVGRDTYIYHRYRQRNKCHGWTIGYSRLSSNAKPYLNAEKWPLVLLWSCLLVCVGSIWVKKGNIASYMLMGGVAASRLGLWMFDLAVIQQMQDQVSESDRCVVGGVQNSLQSALDLMAYVLGFLDIDDHLILHGYVIRINLYSSSLPNS